MAAPAIDDDLRLVLLPGQRNPKLAAGGRVYTKRFVYNDRVVWCCANRRITKCAGSLVVAGEGPFMDVVASTPHSCRPPSDAGGGLSVHGGEAGLLLFLLFVLSLPLEDASEIR